MSDSGRPAAALLDHVNLVVEDIDRSVDFYRALFDLEVSFDRMLEGDWIDRVTGLEGARARCVFLQDSVRPVRIELLQYLNPPPIEYPGLDRPQVIGVRHIALQVPDLDAFVARARDLGARVVSDPVAVPFLLPGRRIKRLCYLNDPNGILLEAAEYRPLDSGGHDEESS